MAGIDNPISVDCSTPERLPVSYSKNFLLPCSQSDPLSIDQSVPKLKTSISEASDSFSGIFYTMAIIGPAVGYLLGGQLLKVYVDFGVDANELGLSPSSTVWVGAWWIGFVFAAVLGLIVALPMLAFPRTLPCKEKVKAGKVSEMHGKLADSEASRIDFGSRLSDLPASFKLLLMNPTFIFLSLAGASEGILVAGLATFLPKLIESQFSYQASFAAFIVGIVTIPGAGGGNLLGGYIVKKFKMKCAGIIRICILFSLICLAFSFIFILHCPDAKFAGVNYNITKKSVDTFPFAAECNIDCVCSTHHYDPVCGVDNIIYFSPCYAGCHNVYQDQDRKVYSDCECIQGQGINMSVHGQTLLVQATREKCDNQCLHGPLFLGIIFLCMFFTFLVSMPSLSATLRCVAESQKSFGLGIQWMAVRLLGTIPAPILFGWLIDKSCLQWQDACGSQRGSCLFYHNEAMSRNILAIVCLVKFLSCSFFFVAWYSYHPPPNQSTQVRNDPSTSNHFVNPSILNSASNEVQCMGIRYLPQESIAVTACQPDTNSVL